MQTSWLFCPIKHSYKKRSILSIFYAKQIKSNITIFFTSCNLLLTQSITSESLNRLQLFFIRVCGYYPAGSRAGQLAQWRLQPQSVQHITPLAHEAVSWLSGGSSHSRCSILPSYYRRVDCVIESSLYEIIWIIGSKNFALIVMSWKFTEGIMNASKVIPENLIYKQGDQPITALQIPDCDWSLFLFMKANFAKLTDSSQIFRHHSVRIH